VAFQPAQIIEGRVMAADTGQPIPTAMVGVWADTKRGSEGANFRADAQGRFQANPYPADHFSVDVFPPEGQPYLPTRVGFAWTKGAVKRDVDVTLSRGIVIRGKITEEGTGRSLSGASVQYLALKGSAENKGGCDAMVASKNDGSFQIIVPPGKGHLLIFGPTPDYILDTIGSNMLYDGEPGGQRHYAHGIVAYEVKAGNQPHEINAVLRSGKTVKGRVIGPQGETVEHAAIITRLHIEPFNSFWRGESTFQLHAREGLFALHGLDPDKSVPVYILDYDHEWGATVELSGKQAGEELTIRLQPTGKAKARFVGADGKPVAKLLPHIKIVATPGGPDLSRKERNKALMSADTALLTGLDPKHYWRPNRLITDAEGRVTLPDLIPGALYRVEGRDMQDRRDFTVKPGETLDLGDILTVKPEP
jgi:hypothetical protein